MLPDVFTVDVTAEDIRGGVASDCRLCPIALGAVRAYPGYAWLVNHERAVARGNDSEFQYIHTGELFVILFDLYESVQPCTVTFTKEAV